MAPRVMTVTGPIPPERVGFTLPHEHTGLSLWHVPGRWDHWQLTADDELVGDELREARRRGAATVVDLTLPGIGQALLTGELAAAAIIAHGLDAGRVTAAYERSVRGAHWPRPRDRCIGGLRSPDRCAPEEEAWPRAS